MLIRTNLGLCIQCIDRPDYDIKVHGECECTVDMHVCKRCGNGPLNEGEELCMIHEHVLTECDHQCTSCLGWFKSTDPATEKDIFCSDCNEGVSKTCDCNRWFARLEFNSIDDTESIFLGITDEKAPVKQLLEDLFALYNNVGPEDNCEWPDDPILRTSHNAPRSMSKGDAIEFYNWSASHSYYFTCLSEGWQMKAYKNPKYIAPSDDELCDALPPF